MKQSVIKKEVVEHGKMFEGKVVSIGMTNTIIVELSFSHAHPLYKKQIRKTKRVAVHNEDRELKVGQFVQVKETRPLSKTVNFIVVRVVKK
ncbi:30S ribosomal protein S17 [Candidatus Gottesmanbacteria bacterium]|nr:30S ribosomal protein S17 [Candidatus Gottesmanbacteria bacterium]